MGKPTCHVSTLQCYKRLLLCKGQGLFVWMPCIYMTWLGGSPVSGKGALLSALQGLQQVLHDKQAAAWCTCSAHCASHSVRQPRSMSSPMLFSFESEQTATCGPFSNRVDLGGVFFFFFYYLEIVGR